MLGFANKLRTNPTSVFNSTLFGTTAITVEPWSAKLTLVPNPVALLTPPGDPQPAAAAPACCCRCCCCCHWQRRADMESACSGATAAEPGSLSWALPSLDLDHPL